MSPAKTSDWPDKTVDIDVKDETLTEIAAELTKQTGIQFVVGVGVPEALKITVRAKGVKVQEFLDTLTASTGLVYVADAQPPLKKGERKPRHLVLAG